MINLKLRDKMFAIISNSHENVNWCFLHETIYNEV